MPENNQILSVEGQLVGIPLQEYTAGPGIVVDNVNKVIRVDDTVTVLTTLSDIGTASISNAFWGSTYALKNNNWVTITFEFDPAGNATVNSGTTVFVVKEGLRPSTNIIANFVVTNSTGQGQVSLQPDGQVVWGSQYNIAAANAYNRVFTFTYPVAPSA